MKILSDPFKMENNRNCVILDYTDSGYTYDELPDALRVLVKQPELHRKEWLLWKLDALETTERVILKDAKENPNAKNQNCIKRGLIWHEIKELIFLEFCHPNLPYQDFLKLADPILKIKGLESDMKEYYEKMDELDYTENRTFYRDMLKNPKIGFKLKEGTKTEWLDENNSEYLERDLSDGLFFKRNNSINTCLERLIYLKERNKLYMFERGFLKDETSLLRELGIKKSGSINTWKDAAKNFRDTEKRKNS